MSRGSGFLVFPCILGDALIHALLVIAAVVFVYNLLSDRRSGV
jgi:Family of unknown function (DUF5670)